MINLNDCTFIIPVRFDSNDRINNVKTVVDYLFKYFDTTVLICEHDDSTKVPQEILKYEKVLNIFIETKDELFYKTKCINDMVKIIKTPYFAIYDADVLIKPEQIIKTLELLREGYETVYPYDGTFLLVPKYYATQLQNRLDTNIVDINACKKGLGMPELTKNRESFGGCVFFNKDSFIKYGMANEKMISYGPEDAEIAYRFRLLSKYNRVSGPVYHMEHVRNLNSTETHRMAQNNHDEFNKIKNMDNLTLLSYIDTWEWNKGI